MARRRESQLQARGESGRGDSDIALRLMVLSRCRGGGISVQRCGMLGRGGRG